MSIAQRMMMLGGSWSPLQLPNLGGLYFADFGTTAGATGIKWWDDQSGSGDSANKRLVQLTGSKQPTLTASDAGYNGKATLLLVAASSQFMASSTFATPITQPFTWWVVGNDDGTVTSQYYLEGDISGASRSILGHAVISAAYGTYSGAEVGGGTRSNAKRILIGVNNGASSSLYISAKTPVATGNAGTNGITAMTMGASFAGTAPLNGKMAALGWCTSALSATDIGLLLDYLGDYYAITIGA